MRPRDTRNSHRGFHSLSYDLIDNLKLSVFLEEILKAAVTGLGLYTTALQLCQVLCTTLNSGCRLRLVDPLGPACCLL